MNANTELCLKDLPTLPRAIKQKSSNLNETCYESKCLNKYEIKTIKLTAP